MPYQVQRTEGGLILELKGGVTVRDATELARCLASSLTSGAEVTVLAEEVDDTDTSILQMLVSLRKTAGAFVLQHPSDGFLDAVDRSALRRELMGASKEAL